jgi:kynurenine formamidase
MMKRTAYCLLLPLLLNGVVAAQAVRSDSDIEELLPKLSNWGKWGKEDQLGTLNYLTDRKRAAAAKLIRTGRSVVLARQTDILRTPGVQEGKREILFRELGTRDNTGAIWHGFALTHLDALCHIYANKDQLYNGIPVSEINKDRCEKLGIDVIAAKGISGRGVLIDIARLKGAPLDPGTPIMIKDLEDAAKQQKLKLRSGDIVFVRTGAGMKNSRDKRAGLHPECIVWAKENEIALLGSDGDSDVAPVAGFDRYASTFHSVGIPYLGLPLIDNLELDALAAECERQKRWEFYATIAPWNLKGGTSSPINPIAIF